MPGTSIRRTCTSSSSESRRCWRSFCSGLPKADVDRSVAGRRHRGVAFAVFGCRVSGNGAAVAAPMRAKLAIEHVFATGMFPAEGPSMRSLLVVACAAMASGLARADKSHDAPDLSYLYDGG